MEGSGRCPPTPAPGSGQLAQRLCTARSVTHYAEAFYPHPGQCFRFAHNDVGHAQHCPEPIVARGTFFDQKGRKWNADACERHREELGSIEGGEVGRRDRPRPKRGMSGGASVTPPGGDVPSFNPTVRRCP